MRRALEKTWHEQLRNAINALRATSDSAIVYFSRRDFLGEAVDPIQAVWQLPEPTKILRKQTGDGSWPAPPQKTPIYPGNHARLVASFKAFRILIEKYQFTRECAEITKAAEYLFKFQTSEGDLRGFIGNQYATYYTGYVLALLIQAGYANDPRVEYGMKWLLKMRQSDGGWSVPILTHHFDGKTMYRLTSSYAEPIEPDRTQPFSHHSTDMVLRAFAAHPRYRCSKEARVAGGLLKSRFFQPDAYSSYHAASYWTRFVFWWPNLLTAMESLAWLEFTAEDPDISQGLHWFFDNQQKDGLWECSYGGSGVTRSKGYPVDRIWVSLRIGRMLSRFVHS